MKEVDEFREGRALDDTAEGSGTGGSEIGDNILPGLGEGGVGDVPDVDLLSKPDMADLHPPP